jgi:hypothetical protein
MGESRFGCLDFLKLKSFMLSNIYASLLDLGETCNAYMEQFETGSRRLDSSH